MRSSTGINCVELRSAMSALEPEAPLFWIKVRASPTILPPPLHISRNSWVLSQVSGFSRHASEVLFRLHFRSCDKIVRAELIPDQSVRRFYAPHAPSCAVR